MYPAVPNPDFTATSNGCGAEGGSSFPSFEWGHCCDAHDICYGTCNSSKEECDTTFNTCMEDSCEGADCALVSVYFKSVDWFGDSAFDEAQGQACTCNGACSSQQ
eukprot:TRINITY_DN56939_c0_g1_i1.p3 TRINITY_DN56939_c0_g1~~TRINITY_DN56939_c0_g1_i1.p3  ORF type:complete len:113 (-),score=15.17 TRINITY_DN56939_c0_g1_i1:62-376(-)